MASTAVATGPDVTGMSSDSTDRRHRLSETISHAAHLLPAQGPIEVFVHHNTLHAFEEFSFHDAVRKGSETYGANPYFPEQQYRDMLESGRIRITDLKAVLHNDDVGLANDPINGLGTRRDLRLAMLLHPLRTGPDTELRWVIAETDALSRFRPEVSSLIRERMLDATEQFVLGLSDSDSTENGSESETLQRLRQDFGQSDLKTWSDRQWEEFTLRYLWAVCRNGIHNTGNGETPLPKPVRVRGALLAATGQDTDRYVHETLIRFCATFLDQGYADWELPNRDAGLFRSFASIYGEPSVCAERWMYGLDEELRKQTHAQLTPLESIDESLRMLGVADEWRDAFITRSLLALGGWAGMIWQLESAADWVNHPAPKGTLIEFLAIRLILDRLAAEYVAREYMSFEGPLNHVSNAALARIPATRDTRFQRTFQVFQIAQSLGWLPHVLEQLTPDSWRALVAEVEAFDELHRRRVFHEAYERKFRIATLDALALHSARRRQTATDPRRAAVNSAPDQRSGAAQVGVVSRSETATLPAPPGQQSGATQRPSFQIVCCIDDREESFRRHIEETDPACETLGAAGFFAVAMNYQGAADAKYKPLCPIIITPQHFVKEGVGYTFGGEHRRRAETRRALGRFTHQVHARSRTFVGGIFTALLGSLAAFPLVARVLFPRLTSQIRRRFGRFVQPPPVTQLQLERYQPEPGPEDGHIGYSVDEMVTLVERLLRDLGLTTNFARLVVIAGHGSSSINNPHESAYNCGACAGKRGGPNARAFAHMANDWRVRARLIERGIAVPDDTAFVGCYHNTCDDSVVWYDLDRLPPSHRADFERTKRTVDEAQLRNAHERCRRFRAASLKLSLVEALRHVEQRSEDLSQVRPEYNHATNALCFVGRRCWSRGLYLDRRAFLTSYDPAVDDAEHSVLLRILGAAIPVCAGISLEYYFSCVDNVKFGSGSKLPHNIASLLGVMEGATSDLRTGLYQQMIEIHEPMRILFVIETTPAAILSIMDRHAGIARLCHGEWVQLAVIDPDTSDIKVYRGGSFEAYEPSTDDLPTVSSSLEWYQGRRKHLDFVSIREVSHTNGDEGFQQ